MMMMMTTLPLHTLWSTCMRIQNRVCWAIKRRNNNYWIQTMVKGQATYLCKVLVEADKYQMTITDSSINQHKKLRRGGSNNSAWWRLRDKSSDCTIAPLLDRLKKQWIRCLLCSDNPAYLLFKQRWRFSRGMITMKMNQFSNVTRLYND